VRGTRGERAISSSGRSKLKSESCMMIYAKKTAASINFFLFYGGNCSILKRKNAICFKNKQMQIFCVDSAEKSRIIPFIHSRGGEIGRRGGLKIRCQR